MSGQRITPIPTRYRSVRFRSTLEADWAATLDSLDVEWQYEPVGVRLPSGVLYRPDFYLPKIATWLEVKGPEGSGLDKTRELARAVGCEPGCDGGERCAHEWDPYQLVVVGLAPVCGEVASYVIDGFWSPGDEPRDSLNRCTTCGAWWWCGSGAYGCRAHRRGGSGDEDLGGGAPAFVQLKRPAA